MKSILSTLALLAACADSVLGHWNYHRLVVNGEWIGEPYQYIRRTNNTNEPLRDVSSNDMRCNAGGASGNSTQTYTVKAGDELGFGIASTFGHPGPQQVYISKAPSAAAAYDGSGNWTRIYSATTAVNNTIGPNGLIWATQKIHSFRFPLPASTPPGDYLIRAEGLALHAAHKLANAQFYVACAQVHVTGNGTGTLEPSIKFPGGYTTTTPGVLIPDFWTKIRSYTAPGPALWPSGTQETHAVKQVDSNPDFRPRSVITRRRQFHRWGHN